MALHLQHHGHAHGSDKRHAAGGPPAVVQLTFAGANPNAQVVGLDALPGTANYLLGATRQHWRTKAPTYARVAYRGLYPGIDLAFHGQQGTLEYDWLLAPHAAPGRIRLAVRGAGRLHLDRQGDLLLDTAAGTLRQARPVAYTARALIPAPYCTVVVTPAGNAPVVVCRHRGHIFSSARCSLTSRRSGGRSTTWRRAYPVAATPSNAAWHSAQVAGLCTITRSGSSTMDKAFPGCPGCPPTAFPLCCRRLRGGRWYPSLDGGLLLVRLVVLAWSSRSLTRALNAAICSCCAVMTACTCSITPITASTPPAYTTVISSRVSRIVVSLPPHPVPPAAALYSYSTRAV